MEKYAIEHSTNVVLSKRHELNDEENNALVELEDNYLEFSTVPALITLIRRDNEIRSKMCDVLDKISVSFSSLNENLIEIKSMFSSYIEKVLIYYLIITSQLI